MKPIILASKVVLISCMLLACTGGDGILNKRSQGPTHIVIVAPFSGPLSGCGRSIEGGSHRVGAYNLLSSTCSIVGRSLIPQAGF